MFFFYRRPHTAIFLWLLVAFSVCTCSLNGSETYALWQTYKHPDGEFTFYYLAPPWILDSTSSPEHPIMKIDAYSTPSEYGLDARMRMEAWDQGGTAAQLLANRTSLWTEQGFEVVSQDDIENAAGDLGLRLDANANGHWVTEVLFDTSGGAVVMSIFGQGAIEYIDVNAMVDGFSPGLGF